MNSDRVFEYPFGDIYRLYLAKIERKGHTRDELDTVLTWLTGYTASKLADDATAALTLREFFAQAPELNPNRELITGVICGVRVEDIDDTLMREIRYMDKVVDELARGKKIASIMRAPRS